MNEIDEKLKMNSSHKHKKTLVHNTLAHSYLVYFGLLIIGLLFDLFLPIKIFVYSTFTSTLGLVFIFLASLLIFWAQYTSHKLNITREITSDTFYKGPYRYTRGPTHLGLFFLILGFAFVINAFFLLIFAIIAFFLTKSLFLKKQEDLLVEKYGEPYKKYQKIVHF